MLDQLKYSYNKFAPIYKMEYFEYSPPSNEPLSSHKLIEDLQIIANKLNVTKITQSIYTQHGQYNCSTYIRRFGTWNNALEKAKLTISNFVDYSDEQLFENLLNIWQKLGKQPTRRDVNRKSISTISSSPYHRRFGTWTNTLKEFISYVNDKEVFFARNSLEFQSNSAIKTNRDPSLRIRYQVLKRDNFSCSICGASPAKNPAINLQIDHIKAWSKGGQTELINLQTLCSSCNLGKSNLD
ncbi:MAG: homing endonuclease associated repeat-containing protein [Candidatus Melainabacteria bacterium]